MSSQSVHLSSNTDIPVAAVYKCRQNQFISIIFPIHVPVLMHSIHCMPLIKQLHQT